MNRSRVTGDLASHGNIFVDIANDRVGIGSTIPGQKLSLPDSAKIALGNSADLSLYHDGTNSYVNNATGTLFYLANTHYFTNPALSELQAQFVKNGAVKLYHDNSQKFETTSTGITASGTQHIFSSGTSGDCTVIIEADTDNNAENENPKLVFKQDGGIEEAAIGMNLTNANNNTANEFFIASGINEGAIVLATTSTNGYTNATERLRVTPAGNIQIPVDSGSSTVGRLQIGASQDLEIYHDSFNSIIEDSGSGNLLLKSNMIVGRSTADENLFKAIENAAVELYYNNVKRFETTGVGANVIGNFVADCSNSIDPDSNTNHFITGTIQDGSGWSAQGIAFGQGTGKMAAFGVSNSLYMAHGDGSNANSLTTFIEVSNAGRVRINYSGSTKLETTSTGINVAGNITATGTLDTGNATINRVDVTVVTDGSRNNGAFIEPGDTGQGNRPKVRLKGAGNQGLSQEAIQVFYDNGSTKSFELDYEGNIEARDLHSRRADFTAGIGVTGGITNIVSSHNTAMLTLTANMGSYNNRSLIISSPVTDSTHNPFRFQTSNAFEFQVDGARTLFIHESGRIDLYHDGGASPKLSTSSTGIDIFSDLTLTDTTADSAAGPEFKLFRNSASPADADYLGQIKFAGESDTGVERNYAKITGKILDASNGTEDGIIEFAHIKAGSQTITGRWRSDSLQLLNGTSLTVAGTAEVTGTSSLGNTVSIDTTQNEKLVLRGSSNPYIRFKQGTNDKAYIQWDSGNARFIFVNQASSEELQIGSGVNGLIFRAESTNYTVWHGGNDGTGSGLDADLLDGVQGSSFLRSDTNNTSSGTVAFGAGALDPDSFASFSGGFGGIGDGSGWGARGLFVHGGGTGDAAAMAHNGSALYFGIQDGANANSMETWLQVTPGSRIINFSSDNNNTNVQIGGNKIFHTGNDGSGSGFDADTVDGLNAASFLRSDQNDSTSGFLNVQVLRFNGVGSNSNNASPPDSYAIYQAGGSWTSPYPDLVIGYHTGIKIGALGSYGGTRFYSDAPERSGAQEIFSVGNGDSNTRVNNQLFVSGTSRNRFTGSTSFGAGGVGFTLSANGTYHSHTVGHNASQHAGIFWHTNGNYGIYRTAGNWSGNYSQLRLDWPTGIIIDGGTGNPFSGVHIEGHLLPISTNTSDLGNSSYRWRNLYTNDLNLSNEGGTNDVDGTWGSYTIQEGEDDLFLINKRNGKKYKFNLTEVS